MKITSPEYRITIGTIIIFYVMVMEILSAIQGLHFHFDQTVAVSLIGFGSGLITAGIIKQHKSFRDVPND